MNEKPVIDHAVDDKIDKKIEQAQLPPVLPVSETRTQKSMPPTTTVEEDTKSAAQRDINFTWEDTQKRIALFVVYTTMGVSGIIIVVLLMLKMLKYEVDMLLGIAAFTFMTSTTSLVVGFYFSRTNHARIGDEKKSNDRGGLDDR